MKDVILIAESSICNEVGSVDLTAETIGDNLVISAQNHDGYEWKSKCSIEHAFLKLVDALGREKAKELFNKI